MKTKSLTPENTKDLIQAAKVAVAEDQTVWDQIAEYFEDQRKRAEKVVEPRKTKDY